MIKGDKSTLNEKQIVGLINSSPSKRYKSMMTIAADTSKIWCMGNDDGFLAINRYAEGLRGLIGRVCMEFAIYKGELFRYFMDEEEDNGIYVEERELPKELDAVVDSSDDEEGKLAIIDEHDERISDIFKSRIYYRYDEPQLGEEGYKGFFVVGNARGSDYACLYATTVLEGWDSIGKYEFAKKVPVSELQDVVWVKTYIKKDGVLLEEELVEEKKIDNTEIKEILDRYLLDNII